MKKIKILFGLVICLASIFSGCQKNEIEDYNLFEGVVCEFNTKKPLPDTKIVMIRTYHDRTSNSFQNTVYDTIKTDSEGWYRLNLNSGTLGNNRLYAIASANEDYSTGNIRIAQSTTENIVNRLNFKRIIFNRPNIDSVFIDKTSYLQLNFKNQDPAHKKLIVSKLFVKEPRGIHNNVIQSEIEIFRSTSTSPGVVSIILELMHGLNPSVVLNYKVERETLKEAGPEEEPVVVKEPPVEEVMTINLSPHSLTSREISY